MPETTPFIWLGIRAYMLFRSKLNNDILHFYEFYSSIKS